MTGFDLIFVDDNKLNILRKKSSSNLNSVEVDVKT
jgi:hypothetical protein